VRTPARRGPTTIFTVLWAAASLALLAAHPSAPAWAGTLWLAAAAYFLAASLAGAKAELKRRAQGSG
jgi:hypothetical protein